MSQRQIYLWIFLSPHCCRGHIFILFGVFNGATPGKMAISAKVVDAVTGEHPSTPRYIARYFSYALSGLPLGLGFIWIGVRQEETGLA